jgi:4-hydroxy-tetrahydrodipicolinate synthase
MGVHGGVDSGDARGHRRAVARPVPVGDAGPAAGAIMAAANVCTRRYADMVRARRTGQVTEGRTLGNRLAGLSAALFAEPNPVVIKAVLHAQGRIPSSVVRLPLLPASPGAIEAAVRAATNLATRLSAVSAG